jgi:hypothetical protein
MGAETQRAGGDASCALLFFYKQRKKCLNRLTFGSKSRKLSI